ncbi:hypothetical protein D9757_011132 [Collybiopsis confluens]|uniref:DUF6593 domain-containing protein n=1 Tax=Collybiopsis confluens TaxID=2823264 RepID=A0A8H5H7X1_9AGAR|nr:hypothetical protein D9757_011132 [Collybiopsis confluens]
MSSIHLYPSFGGLDPILNNTYKDGNGTVQYVVRTPTSLTGFGRVTTIFKTKANSLKDPALTQSTPSQAEYLEDPLPEQNTEDNRASVNLDETLVVAQTKAGEEEEEKVVEVEEDGMLQVGQIGWNLFKSSTIVFRDEPELPAVHYFRKESWGWWGRHRAFYKWVLGFYTPQVSPLLHSLLPIANNKYAKLIVNDGSNTVVAQFHRQKFILWNTPPGYLEILPGGVDMIDTILVTFICIEKLRRNK